MYVHTYTHKLPFLNFYLNLHSINYDNGMPSKGSY